VNPLEDQVGVAVCFQAVTVMGTKALLMATSEEGCVICSQEPETVLMFSNALALLEEQARRLGI
jgi:hypothetical protein